MHDARGRALAVGDTILVAYKIEGVSPSEDYCNVSARSLIGRKPDGSKEYYSGNAAVVFRANPGDENTIADLTKGE